ncbi:MAG: myo-inosose-2 dehydratase, partial [Gammaproteobacteria bacterium]
MAVKLGINPITWSNDDLLALGGETPLETCLAEGKQAGFAGFELGNKFPRDPAILQPILQSYGLALVSGWFSGRLLERSVNDEIEAIQPHLNLLKTLGATAMVYCEVTHCIHGDQSAPLSTRPVLPDDQWAAWGKRLNELAAYTLDQGVKIAYHHHMGTVVQSEVDIDRLMANTGEQVGLLLDTGHLTYAGSDPLVIQQRYATRINHVHCKDVRPAILKDALNRDLSFLNAVLNGVFTVPGDGCVDYASLFAELKQADYRGWLVV